MKFETMQHTVVGIAVCTVVLIFALAAGFAKVADKREKEAAQNLAFDLRLASTKAESLQVVLKYRELKTQQDWQATALLGAFLLGGK